MANPTSSAEDSITCYLCSITCSLPTLVKEIYPSLRVRSFPGRLMFQVKLMRSVGRSSTWPPQRSQPKPDFKSAPLCTGPATRGGALSARQAALWTDRRCPRGPAPKSPLSARATDRGLGPAWAGARGDGGGRGGGARVPGGAETAAERAADRGVSRAGRAGAWPPPPRWGPRALSFLFLPRCSGRGLGISGELWRKAGSHSTAGLPTYSLHFNKIPGIPLRVKIRETDVKP